MFVVLFASVLNSLYAQTGKVSGRVIDAKTLQPLPFTNVYVNNTTMGASANDAGEFVLQNLPVGTTDIVFSFLGYIPQQVKLVVKETGNPPIAIQLIPDTQLVSEVQVKAGRDKAWEKQLKRFEKVFLGNTSACKILNPWVIDFTDQSGGMTAKAALPVEIENKVLGYKLYFQLKNFSYSSTEFSIVGDVRFTELETSDASVALDWMKNRERAYRGSAKHLMKSILDRQINKQGFLLYRDKVKGKLHSTNYTVDLQQNIVPYDTTSLVSTGSGVNEFRIAIKDKLEVIYTTEFTTTNFYTDLSNPVSWIETKGGFVLVNKEGTLLNPTSVAIAGTMSEARVSSMLPLNYKPGSLIVPQSASRLLAKRLQENVYLHTDKPYYYPGDNIWFSAYMNYRTPGLMDTLSKVLYVDLIDADRVTSQHLVLPIDSGRTASSFRLPAMIKPGKYVLRAYTQWMRNYGIDQFFYKPIRVLSLDQRADGVAYKPLNDNGLKVGFDQPDYKKRSKVNMKLSLDTTVRDDVIKGRFSVAVVDETYMNLAAGPSTIKTDFDLSDLSKEVLQTNYPIERGITIDGIYKDKKGKGKKTKLTLIPENFGGIYQASTDENGAFSLTNLAFYDSSKFVIQPTDGRVMLQLKDVPNLPENLPDLNVRLVSMTTPHVVYSMDTLQARTLSEVKVAAKKITRSENAYAQPDFVLEGKNIETYASAADAIAAKLPSFKLVYEQTTWYLIWGRSSTPTSTDLSSVTGTALASHEPNLYIDNVLVVGMSAGDRLMQFNPAMIDHIEVNGMITSNQGANGSAGLINVYTKRSSEGNSKALSIINVRGFDREVPFRSPSYDRPATASTTVDYRSTLYWNPRVNLTYTPSEFSFFTSDQPGTYRVVIEGVTNKGTPIHSEALFQVK